MHIWSTEEEAENLKRRFDGTNRAEFARANGVPGDQAVIYQHITGRRPISLEAAIAYAKGFGCTIREISPRLALEVSRAMAFMGTPDQVGTVETSTGEAQPQAGEWPFVRVSPTQWRELPEPARQRIEELAEVAVLAREKPQDPVSAEKASTNVTGSKNDPFLPHQPDPSAKMYRGIKDGSEGKGPAKPSRGTGS
ncbi:helix-turn-helix domain-containing protein [Cupriavidus basilensis]